MSPEEATGDSNVVRVLVVDDEPDICKLFAIGLQRTGCEVRTAENGREALDKLAQQECDVLVVDIGMPVMDGIVFLREALKLRPGLGVVVVAGYVDSAAAPELDALGIENIISKPVNMKEFVKVVKEVAPARGDADTG